jgi:hypothetical protein
MSWIIGKVVQVNEETIAQVTGSFHSNSVAGGAGMVYGGGGSGGVGTSVHEKQDWRVFTRDEEYVSFKHETDVVAEPGDIVAIQQAGRSEEEVIGIMNFTKDHGITKNVQTAAPYIGAIVTLTVGFFAYLFAISEYPGESDMLLFSLGIFGGPPAVYTFFAARALRFNEEVIKEFLIQVDELKEQLRDEIEMSRTRMKERFQTM